MTVVAVNAGTCGDGLPPGIAPHLRAGAPVTVMIHGFRYTPDDPRRDPNADIFALSPRGGLSWPRRLGYGRGAPGVAVGFGWRGSGTLWQAHERAEQAGDALGSLVRGLRGAGAGRVNLIAHSLGARVALAALHGLAPGDVGRIVLLSGAEFRERAKAALMTPAGRATEVLNVTSRENDAFDFLFETLIGRRHGPTLGAGLHLPHCATLQIDGAAHRKGLASLGYPVAPASRLVCHWSAYMRPGLFPLYRAFLHQPDRLPLGLLRGALPSDTAPRWSRILPRAPLPPGRIAAQ
ncbi:MAG: alpha/beta hydrolase [Paracoccaceae bacterium]|nr:MAG: alpha/beta hydrolase [Paracoccaceae bacterium]